MLRRAGRAGDEPAAEAAIERLGVADRSRQREVFRPSASCRTEHQQSGYTERVAGHVTAETDEGALELRRRVRALIEGIKDDARRGVVGGDLENRAAAHPAEGDAIAEEQRARVLLV